DGLGLMFRFINERKTQIVELEASCLVSFEEAGGRRFLPLNLERNKISMLALNWTIVHPINEQSPFHNLSREEILAKKPELLVMVKGFEETFGQIVYSRTSYDWKQWVFNAKFLPITEYNPKLSGPVLHADRLDHFEVV
ncbi:MAG: K+ channel, inward rectifier, partial [Luteibaculum sp.]